MIAAILRAQLLSMRPGSNRGAGLGVLVAFFWYGFWLFVAWWAGLYTAMSGVATLRYALPLGLLGICFYWQAMPVLSASMGSSLDLRKLLLYPTPHEKLFLVEILLRFTTGIEMQMVLAGGVAGLLRNRQPGVAAALPLLLGAIAVFILFNLLLASGTRSLLERLLARRKVRELVALALAMVWMTPRFLMMSGVRVTWLHAAGEAMGQFGWPWSAAALAALPLGQSGPATLVCWLALGAWTALAGWFGRTQFERNLRYDTLAAQATPLKPGSALAGRWSERFFRFPCLLWRDPLACIVEKELRTLARSPRFRMVFVMGFTFGLMIWLPMILRRGPAHAGAFGHNFLTIVCVYAMTLMGQVTYWNCFGIDRSAAVFYFAAPQPLSQTLLGKNIACLFFVYLEAVVLMSVTLAVRIGFGLGQAVETFVVIAVCATYLMALGNISSVHYPRALSPGRVSQGGGNRAQALVMLLYPVVLLPVILAYVARYAFDSQAAFSLVLALAAALGAIFYRLAMESAVHAASTRRQYILEELSKGDGPIGS
jgi:ABC-2 type transport system permease protein